MLPLKHYSVQLALYVTRRVLFLLCCYVNLQILEHCAVTGIETAPTMLGSRKVTAVITPHGRIATDCVVNCAGGWGANLGALANVSVPLTTYRHAYVVTEAIDRMRGSPSILEFQTELYCRPQGDSLIFGGYETNPMFIEKVC